MAILRKGDWSWLAWQVGLPLVAPIATSFLVIVFWDATGDQFILNLGILIDVSPWALAIYGLALIATTARDQPKAVHGRKGFAWAAGGAGAAQILLFSILVIRRHQPTYVPPQSAYLLALGLALLSIIICLIYRRAEA